VSFVPFVVNHADGTHHEAHEALEVSPAFFFVSFVLFVV
jgi:hypothetical protein